MLTEKDYCDYDTCVALKELGFDEVTHYYFNKDGVRTPRIPLYEAQKFLREKEIMVYPQYLTNGQTWMCMMYEVKTMLMHAIGRGFYNEVLNAGIKEAVKILKEE